MAVYYFDQNGATAGFGTLTGNWDTTTALWSTSSAGTSATSAVTFTDADTAQFGFTGTTATAGTATIQNGTTVTLNQIVTANLAGVQTIAATGTGALSLAGTTPTVNVGSAGNLTISAPIAGSAGLTKAGANNLVLTGTNNFTGGVSIGASAGTVTAGANGTTGTFGDSANNISIGSGSTASVNRSNAYTINGNITGAGTFSKVTGTGTLTLGGATISVSTMTLSAGTTEFSGNQTVSSVIGGAGAITKIGSGTTTTFSGGGAGTNAWTINSGATLDVTTTAHTGTGAVTVNGTLTNSAAMSSKAITVNNGGSLTSTAAIGALTVAAGGTASIGATTGALNLTGEGVTFTSATATTTNFSLGSAGAKTVLSVPAQRTINFQGNLPLGPSDTSNGRIALYTRGNISKIAGALSSTWLGGSSGANAYAYWAVLGNSVSLAGGNTNFSLGGYTDTSGNWNDGSPALIEINNGASFTFPNYNAWGNSSTFSNAIHVISGTATAGNNTAWLGGYTSPNRVTGASTVQNRISVENASSLTISGTFTMVGTAAGALSQITVNGPSALFSTQGGASTGATPKRIDLVNGGKLTATGALSATGANIEIRAYGTAAKLGSSTVATGVLSSGVRLTDVTGSGVTSIPVIDKGSGYVGPPIVTIRNTAGANGAVARAVWNETTKEIDEIVIISPGTGYENGTTTVELTGATAANGCCTTEVVLDAPDIGANTPAGWEKVDTGTLSIAADNTCTLPILITDGTLRIGNGGTAGSIGTSPVSILFGQTLNFNRNDALPIVLTYTNLISGAGNITKTTSGGTAVLDADNTFMGSVTATTGALRAVRAQSFGTGNKTLTTGAGGAIELANNITLPLAQAVTLLGTGVSSTGALRNISGNNTIQGTLSISGAFSIGSDAGTLTLSNPGAVALSSANTATFVGNGDIDLSSTFTGTNGTVTKASGTGCAILRGTNTYTGATTITAGLLGYVGSISGLPGSFGGSGSILIAAGAGVRYYGAGGTWAFRSYTFQGGAGTTNRLEADASATGAINHQLAPVFGTTNVTKTIQLGGTSTQSNKISFAVINNGTGAVSVTKADAGKWELSANNTATGAYAVNGGTLVLSGTNTPASVAVSNSGSTLVFSVATWSGFSTRTGTATVTVNANAKIQTLTGSGASAQNGRHGYNNLTFAANARIRIGG